MKLSRDKIQRMIDVGSGGSSGGVSSSQLAGMLIGYATETWVDEHYISIDFFSRLFQAHGTENGSEIDVMPNDMETTITSVESMFGFWTNLYISALGSNGAAPAGISLGMLTDVSISGTPSAGQVLTFDAVTQKWVNGNAQAGATALANLTDVTLTSVQGNQVLLYDAYSSKWVNSAMKTINGQSLLGSGDISVGGGASGNYLPLSGGTLTGSLTISAPDYGGRQLIFKNGESFDGYGNFQFTNAPTSTWSILNYNRTRNIIAVSQDDANMTINSSNDRYLKLYGTTSNWVLIGFKDIDHYFGLELYSNRFFFSHGIRIQGDLKVLGVVEADLIINAYDLGNDHGIYLRNLSDAPYNCSIFVYDHNSGGANADGISINGYDGVSFCTGSNTRQERMRVAQNGNIGIGTTSPSYTLHVAGTIYATGAITALSDARKKDITGEAGVTVEQIAHAPAVQFLWKDKERRKDGQQVGTLAQYWQTVLPEVVSDKGGELSMQYGVAALVSAIVTARKVVDHERRITELENENERLKKEVEQLRLN